MRTLGVCALVCASIAAPLGLVPHADAQPSTAPPATVAGELFVILASDTPGTIDPALSSLPLRRAPFDGYGTMSLLSHPTPSLTIGTPYDETLPNGRVMRLVIDSVTDDGRYVVRVSINRPGDTDYLPVLALRASPGDPFFVAGQRMTGGILIIAIRLGTAGS